MNCEICNYPTIEKAICDNCLENGGRKRYNDYQRQYQKRKYVKSGRYD